MNLDLLACCHREVMNEVQSQRLVLEGPVRIQQDNRVRTLARECPLKLPFVLFQAERSSS
jgi:hypothetical protein